MNTLSLCSYYIPPGQSEHTWQFHDLMSDSKSTSTPAMTLSVWQNDLVKHVSFEAVHCWHFQKITPWHTAPKWPEKKGPHPSKCRKDQTLPMNRRVINLKIITTIIYHDGTYRISHQGSRIKRPAVHRREPWQSRVTVADRILSLLTAADRRHANWQRTSHEMAPSS